VNGTVTHALRSGDVFAVFPEGTTTDGTRLLRFHGSLFQPALLAGAAVQPIALRYEHLDGSLCTEAAYDEGRSLWQTVRAISAQPGIVARVTFLEPLRSDREHRRELARDAHDAILRTLFPEAKRSRTGKAADP
jgi:1-acyl-sn-glycerol-3-phosphate acyltransferase